MIQWQGKSETTDDSTSCRGIAEESESRYSDIRLYAYSPLHALSSGELQKPSSQKTIIPQGSGSPHLCILGCDLACYATECHGIVGSTPVESCDLEIGCIKDALMDAAQFYYDFDTSEFGDFEDNPFVHFDMIMSAIRSSLSDNCRIENPDPIDTSKKKKAK
ncbi:uncharacterized protein LOC143035559 [Oratosquilla oratoria]|uniref:uncharacterized protein LOC143035559 n=1 Tax=Oratosquilla oratoria TaxID=337810 RepID=UPI003F771587